MRTPRVIPIACLVLVAGVLIVTLALRNSSPPVSLTIIGFATNQWTADNDRLAASRNHVCAIVELTNSGSRSVSYWGWDLGSGRGGRALGIHPHSTLLYPTPAGWIDPVSYESFGIGFRQFTLARSQAIRFEVLLERDKPCRVALDYSDGCAPNRLLQRLPHWIVQRLPGAKTSHTVTTDEIDWDKTMMPGHALQRL